MYENWSPEELISRFELISSEYKVLAEDVTPKLAKLSRIEKELYLLSKEITKRGLEENANPTQSGGSNNSPG